jgi:hypothetical protein
MEIGEHVVTVRTRARETSRLYPYATFESRVSLSSSEDRTRKNRQASDAFVKIAQKDMNDLISVNS